MNSECLLSKEACFNPMKPFTVKNKKMLYLRIWLGNVENWRQKHDYFYFLKKMTDCTFKYTTYKVKSLNFLALSLLLEWAKSSFLVFYWNIWKVRYDASVCAASSFLLVISFLVTSCCILKVWRLAFLCLILCLLFWFCSFPCFVQVSCLCFPCSTFCFSFFF